MRLDASLESTPRVAALELLVSWDLSKQDFIEKLLHDYLRLRQRSERPLAAADSALLAHIAYGVVRHRNTLRRLCERFLHMDLRRYPRTLRMALSIGLYQVAYMRIPPHAAVDETVRMWDALAERRAAHPRRRERGRALLNGTLRGACREIEFPSAESAEPDSPDTIHTPSGWVRIPELGLPARHVNLHEMLGFKYSHPPEMVRVWLERMDEAALVSFLIRNNQPQPIYLVLKDIEVDAFCRALGGAGHPARPGPEHGMVALEESGPIAALPGYESGEFWVQDPTSHRLARMMPAREGATLLDLCASPGGKLCTLLARGGYRRVLACDVSERKLRRLAENLERLRFDLSAIEVLEVSRDATMLRLDRTFDQVLVDVPCSNSGVLARRHEARWRLSPETFRELERIQLGLLRTAARALERGGDLLYSTCSIEPRENREIVHAVLRTHAELRLVEEIEVIPAESEVGDGGYGALLRRVE